MRNVPIFPATKLSPCPERGKDMRRHEYAALQTRVAHRVCSGDVERRARRWANPTGGTAHHQRSYSAPGSLQGQEYIDIVSYLFKVNMVPTGLTELSYDREKLKQILVTETAAGQPPRR